jgi:hypothetical protein
MKSFGYDLLDWLSLRAPCKKHSRCPDHFMACKLRDSNIPQNVEYQFGGCLGLFGAFSIFD